MLDTHDPIAVLAVVLVSGLLLGRLSKMARLPSVTGQILAGFLIGPAVLGWLDHHANERLAPLTQFALALISVTVGSHLSFRALKNAGRRLVMLMLLEATITPVLVFAGLAWFTKLDWTASTLAAAIAIATAPATVVAIVAELRARGVFVQTLMAAVALNNIACLAVFELAHEVVRNHYEPAASDSLGSVVLAPMISLVKAALLGGGVGLLVITSARGLVKTSQLATVAISALVLLLALGDAFDVSPLLAGLFLGVLQVNLTPNKDEFVESFFSNLRPAILAVFFTLAGLHLDVQLLGQALAAGLVVFSLRILGKMMASAIAMRVAGATERIREYLGIALAPQAGLAVGLVVVIEGDPALESIRDQLVTLVLAVVTANEIVGPLLTRLAIEKSGEAHKDEERVLDFLREENITVNLEAETMDEAITEMVNVLARTQRLSNEMRDELLESVLERERRHTTCLGDGLAVPHGRIGTNSMVGVMGLSRAGLHLDAPDGKPVHCVVLLGTPEGERDRHLEVLASLARLFGHHPSARDALYEAISPAHAYEVLHVDDESDIFNHVLKA